jgi:hypothetical protein
MPKYQFVIEGPCAECVAAEVSPEVAKYWSAQDTDMFQEYIDCDADSRNEEFDVPDDAQIDVEWHEMDSEAHLNGPLVGDGTVLVVWDVDQDKVVLRVPITEVRIRAEELLEPDDTYEGDLDDADSSPPPYFKAVATGKGSFLAEPIELPANAIRIEDIAMDVYTFENAMVVTCIGVDNDLLDLEEESSRTNSMSCWID